MPTTWCRTPWRAAGTSWPRGARAATCAPGCSASCTTCTSTACAPAACREPLDDTCRPHGDAAAGRLALRDLDSALRLLPPEQREVVLLVALEELSYEEVAALLQIPAGTVMSRLSRGRERLRLLMEGQPLPSPLKVIK
jgi:DNA-directed RNA polymerase specialized sigma24 family protein